MWFQLGSADGGLSPTTLASSPLLQPLFSIVNERLLSVHARRAAREIGVATGRVSKPAMFGCTAGGGEADSSSQCRLAAHRLEAVPCLKLYAVPGMPWKTCGAWEA